MWLDFEEAKKWGGWKEAKKSYDIIWKFQIEWTTKLPWAKGLVAKMVKFIHIVKCKVCFFIENKEENAGC